MKLLRIQLVGMICLMLVGGTASAEAPPPPSRTLQELISLFPSIAQLPSGMGMFETGERSAAEISATFPDPADTTRVLKLADWRYNAFRNYVAQPGAGRETPARIEVSLHQFSSAGGASYMLPYFSNGRAVKLNQDVVAPWVLGPCWGAVNGTGEVTLYFRIGDLLIRITAVSQSGLSGSESYFTALKVANEVALVILTNAGSSRQVLERTCQ